MKTLLLSLVALTALGGCASTTNEPATTTTAVSSERDYATGSQMGRRKPVAKPATETASNAEASTTK